MHKQVLIPVLISMFLFLLVVDMRHVSSQIEHYPLASGIYIHSPMNRTYTTQMLNLNVSVHAISASNLRVSMSYNIDGTINKTISLYKHARENSFQAQFTGTVTLPHLSIGSHNITVFAKHTINNNVSHLDNRTVCFTVSEKIPAHELIPPSISNLSLQSITNDSTELLLGFNVDKAVSWTGYCLDGQGNRTITFFHDVNRFGNQITKILRGLADGDHSLVVYANNTAEKTGASERICFTVIDNSKRSSRISNRNTNTDYFIVYHSCWNRLQKTENFWVWLN